MDATRAYVILEPGRLFSGISPTTASSVIILLINVCRSIPNQQISPLVMLCSQVSRPLPILIKFQLVSQQAAHSLSGGNGSEFL